MKFSIKVACRVRYGKKKTFYQNSDYFGYRFTKNEMKMKI